MQPSVLSTQGAGAARSATGGSFSRARSAPVNNGAESDSWIEVASHPSDSQYTSSSDDHIITAGLRISQARRRRRGTARPTARPQEVPVFEPEQSSGEDDDESEGEDMGTMIHSMTMSSDDYSSPEDDDDDESDDEASASDSNARLRTGFPSSVPPQRPGLPYRRAQTTPSASTGYNGQNRSHAYGFNSFAPNHAADHDAALRASLSTLLSCAAAARGLPKSSQILPASQSPQQGGRVVVDNLTLVRESGEPSNSTTKPRSLSITSTSTAPASRSQSSESLAMKDTKKLKGKSSSSKSKRRSRSRARETSNENEVMSLSNFSYMTLAISAGAIIVLSAITFSAGYALGKEVGKGEGGLLSSVGSVSRREGGKAALKTTSKGIGMTKFTSVTAF